LGVSEAYAIDAGTCGALMVTYSIVRYVSWGKASLAIQKTWNDSPSVVGLAAGLSSEGLGHAAGQLQRPIAKSTAAQEI